ncbi:MAG: 50S ribosomal protein L11 methyltransferase [Ruminococcaceae bacterium]|nr:50S ribosomal protein L11 methyltransferase [Oscillospiraceae bacterium]
MQWIELSFATTHEASELLTDYLSSLGADGVQIQDPTEIKALLNDPQSLAYADSDFLDQLDLVVRIKAYFALFADGVRCNRDPEAATWLFYETTDKHHIPLPLLEEQIRRQLSHYRSFLAIGEGYLGWQEIKEEDWAENWKKHYHTLHLTPRIVITPSWLSYQPVKGEVVVTLDPGSAFGTGNHETTALCVEWLDERVRKGHHVLDLGCGSGILAIIAALLEAEGVEAIDVDAAAVTVAKDNCRQNQVAIHVHCGTLQQAVRPSYDLIVANIIADVIVDIMPQIPSRLSPGGVLIASGIIDSKLNLVKDSAEATGMAIISGRQRNGWHALLMCRRQDTALLA